MTKNETILVTGGAGFIGNAVSKYLLDRGNNVINIDNVNNYYEVSLKRARLDRIKNYENFKHYEISLEDEGKVLDVFKRHRPNKVINLAAQAGVRYSLENPRVYLKSNIDGFLNILEACRAYPVEHLVYASSSSVYGANRKLPFSVQDNVDHPLSLYAATKKSNELMAHTYSHLFSIPTTGLRFFTVYGPWGRPDMSLFLFTKAILEGQPIDLFNHGNHRRDFTYIDDIVEGVVRVTDRPATHDNAWDGSKPDPSKSAAPYRLFNIGNNHPEELLDFVACIENALGKKAIRNMLPMQPGDVEATYADIEALEQVTGFKPKTSIKDGIGRFVKWYREFYEV